MLLRLSPRCVSCEFDHTTVQHCDEHCPSPQIVDMQVRSHCSSQMVTQSSPQSSWTESTSNVHVETRVRAQGATPANLDGAAGAGFHDNGVCSGKWRTIVWVFRLSESVIGPLIIFAFIFAAFFCIPQSVPQKAMSCTSYEVLGSLHVSVSCCKTEYTQIHTVEVIGSNPIAPTI